MGRKKKERAEKIHEYDSFVKPVINRLVAECAIMEMPMFVTCQTGSSGSALSYTSQLANSPVSMQIPLRYDHIQRHISICADFEVTDRMAAIDESGEICTFDFTNEYEEKIKPIISELYEACANTGIPMFFTCCLRSTDEKTVYEHAYFDDTPNIIQRHLSVFNGYEVTPRNFLTDIDSAFTYYEE